MVLAAAADNGTLDSRGRVHGGISGAQGGAAASQVLPGARSGLQRAYAHAERQHERVGAASEVLG